MGQPPLRRPRAADDRFTNWAGTVASRPARWHEPASEAEVAAIVAAAAAAGRRVRVVGSGHSWSPIAAPGADADALLLDRVAGVVAEGDGTVTVGAGTRLRDLNDALARRGLALPIVGSIAHQAIAGAIATGTHGSSLVHGNLASLVTAMRLVDGRGRVVALAAGDPRLDGARVHLGALGAITELTLRVVPAFRLVETVETAPLAAAARAMEAIARSAEYVKVWWLPHTAAVRIYRYVRTDEPASRRPSPEAARRLDDWVQARLFPPMIAAQRRRPAIIPPVNRALARLFMDTPRRVGPSALLLSTPMPVVHRETEGVVPLARAGEALERVARLVERERLRVNFIVEARFVRGDAGWLSPAAGGDVCQLGAYCGDVPDVDAYFAGFWRELRAMDARPHWGKEFDHAADELRPRWPAWARFAALRDELDPARTFGGAWHARVLGA